MRIRNSPILQKCTGNTFIGQVKLPPTNPKTGLMTNANKFRKRGGGRGGAAGSPPFLRNLDSLKTFGSDSVRAAEPSRSVETNKKNLVGSLQQRHLFTATCWPEICHLIKQRPAQSERSDITLGQIGSKKRLHFPSSLFILSREKN